MDRVIISLSSVLELLLQIQMDKKYFSKVLNKTMDGLKVNLETLKLIQGH